MSSLSVIIPFRNRDGDRLKRAIGSILFGNQDWEVVVVDYGSTDINVAASAVYGFDRCRLLRLEADYWNKSDAINQAMVGIDSEWILVSDTDLFWPDQTIANGFQLALESDALVAFDVRYLRKDTPTELLESVPVAVDSLREWADVNPRWGDGICIFKQSHWRLINGYDTRMSVYGYEDNDFTTRVRRAGVKSLWADFAVCPVFHVWHLPVGRVIAKEVPAIERAYRRNQGLFESDGSVVRNVVEGSVRRTPLVSVVIATAGRSGFLREAIASVLCQSVQDFEIIVVDDGQLDDSEAVVEQFADSRIRYFGLADPRGISFARNLGSREACGDFIAVMDDDDICLPDRLEVSFAAITEGVDGCVGGFITFYDDDGRVTSWDDPLPTIEGAFELGGFAGHPTWMIRRDVFNAFSYDESFTSAVDNNRALRMLNSGVKLVHSGKTHILRRVHNGQVSNQDQQFQSFGAVLDKTWFWSGYERDKWASLVDMSKKSKPKNRAKMYESQFLPYLSDSLVSRQIDVIAYDEDSRSAALRLEGICDGVEAFVQGKFKFGKYRANGDWFNMAKAAQAGLKIQISSVIPTKKLSSKEYVPTSPVFSPSVPWAKILENDNEVVEIRTLKNNQWNSLDEGKGTVDAEACKTIRLRATEFTYELKDA